MGGNQEPWELKAKVGNRVALIGGMDQHNVVEIGTEEFIQRKVVELFEKVGYEGGYVCSLCDHFFDASPERLHYYANAARECVY